MRSVCNKVNKLITHRCCAEPHNGGAGRADHDVGADTAGTPSCAIECAIAYAHQREYHADFNCDRQHTQNGADRSMGKIGEHKLIDQELDPENMWLISKDLASSG